ncbi:MAG: hypothetical protein R3D01_04195 [Hyphomicrobiales bacterium]
MIRATVVEHRARASPHHSVMELDLAGRLQRYGRQLVSSSNHALQSRAD